MLGVDAAMVSKWERGKKRPRKLYRRLLCRLYDATEEQLGLRQARQPAGEMKDTELLSFEATSAQVTHVHCWYQAAQYREVAGWLPSLEESVEALVAEVPQDRRREALMLQCSMWIAAAKLATKVGDASVAWRAAHRARISALQADDPFGQAAAAYQLACALLKSGRREEAEQIAVESGEAITDADPAAHGLIHDLLSRERRGRVPGLRSLAQRAGALA